MSIFRMFAASAVLATLGACAQIPEVVTEPASAELAPALPPLAQAGTQTIYLDKLNGEEKLFTVAAVENGVRFSKNETDGCSWSRLADTPFSPSLSWENCNGYTGSRRIVSTEGALWPLQVGATQTWTSEGTSSDGDTWTETRTCSVKGTAGVAVPAGVFNTYHVNCTSGQRVRDYYYAPEIQRTVISRSTHPKRENWYNEFVRVVEPESS